MLTAKMKLVNPHDMMASITFTATLGEWRELRRSMTGMSGQTWRLVAVMDQVIAQAEAEFSGDERDAKT